MIAPIHNYPEGTSFEADLCVIGGGLAGLALTREFFDTSLQVVLVESGGPRAEPDADALNDGDNVGERPLDLLGGRMRAFGGTGHLWAGQCMPLTDLDLEPRDWVRHSGWPIRLTDLLPFYHRAERVMGIAEAALYDERLYAQLGRRPPAIDPRKLHHAATVYAPSPNLAKTLLNQFRRASNVTVLLRATATRLEPNTARSEVERVHVSAPNGARYFVKARAFALSGGGIENARLLLASDGLGNDRDLVGRFLQDHPNGRAATVKTAHPSRLQDAYGLLYHSRYRFYPKLRLSARVQRDEQVLNCAAMVNSDFADGGIDAARRIVRAVRVRRPVPNVVRELSRILLDAPRMSHLVYRRYVRGLSPTSRDSSIWIQTYAEQAPNPESRISLSSRRDAFGVPVPKIEWRFSELDRRTADVMVSTLADEFRRLGLGDVQRAAWLDEQEGVWSLGIHDAYHPIGTTRMADDPAQGVVDQHCRVHGVSGLYVAGSSVFATGGFANPTLTILALAIRLADRLKVTALRGTS